MTRWAARVALVALGLALTVAASAFAGRVKATQTGPELTLTARLAQPGSYGASCEFPGYLVGVEPQPTNARGKLVLKFLPGVTGAFTCWLHMGVAWSETAAPLAGGRPAVARGVAS